MSPSAASTVSARAYTPVDNQVFQGVAGTPISAYQAAVGRHPAVFEVFPAWGQSLTSTFAAAAAARVRLMINVTTDAIGVNGAGPTEAVSPGKIALGAGDRWLLALGQAIAAGGRPVFIRLMSEMNGYWSPYCAYNADGSVRNPLHDTASFIEAWKRITLILRGGNLASIDGILARLHMPPLQTLSNLPVGKVAMVWVPQVAGAPDLPGNQPSDYFPGRLWVDWVGTDLSSASPDFTALSTFYARYGGLPFTFGEYAISGVDDPSLITELLGWVRAHPRIRMLIYNQGQNVNGPFRLSRYPLSARALKEALAGKRFPGHTPDW